MTTAMVVGRARGVWEEVAALQAMSEFDAVILVGKAGIDYPGRIDHWVTFHIDLFPAWASKRRAAGHPDAANLWSALYRGKPAKHKVDVPNLRLVPCDGGSSGLIGVMVALDGISADRIALAGIPMEDERGHYDEGKDWDEAKKYQKKWIEDAPRMIGRVRSMSGWTMELLGGKPPTREWLEGVE